MYKFEILNPNPDSDVKFFADPDPKQTCQCIFGYAGTIRLIDQAEKRFVPTDVE